MIEGLRWATLRAISTYFNKINLTYSTRDFDTYHISDEHVCAHAAKSVFLATISHIMEFSKDIVLKSDPRISHKQDAFCSATFFF